jgi:hypothetical protein
MPWVPEALYRRRMDLPRLPVDIVPLLVEHLTDQKDLYSATLADKAFNKSATPRLYRSLYARWIGERENGNNVSPFLTLANIIYGSTTF